jgi:Fe-S-cluster containining protein
MQIETAPGRVAKLARQREDENWAFRSFLKGCDIPSSRMDRLVHTLSAEVSAKIDCTACANCCKTISPRLTRTDIARLAAHLGLPPRAFTAQFLRQAEDGDGWAFGARPCPFLANNLCTVYDQRPKDCRSFPHLHKRDFVFRLIQAVQNASLCPIVFNVYEQLKRELWRGRGR